ncbi:MAG TPA: hypothetical protein VIJ58_11110 [Candidatus Dormibacteraeota bacterium]
MEARSAVRGTGISKGIVAVLAVSVTMGLGVAAGVVAKNLSGSAATQSHISQGLGGPAFANPAQRSGNQVFGANAAPAAVPAVGPDDRATTSTLPANSFLGPDAQERNAKLAAAAAPAANKASRGNRYI